MDARLERWVNASLSLSKVLMDIKRIGSRGADSIKDNDDLAIKQYTTQGKWKMNSDKENW